MASTIIENIDCSQLLYNRSMTGLAHWEQTVHNKHKLINVIIRGRSFGVANIMLLSHCGEYLANVKHLYSRHIRQK